MPRRLSNVLFAVAVTAALPTVARGGGTALGPVEYAYFYENMLGTSLEMRVAATSEAAARRAEARALAEIDRLDAVFSGYSASSEFRRWQDAPRGAVKVSPELLGVLAASDRWRDRTNGAFDPRVESLTRLWSAASRRGIEPTPAELANALAPMSRPAWRLDPAGSTAERLSADPLSFNAIAKGSIVDSACKAALDPADGATGVMVCIGGDLRVAGTLSRRIGVADPRRDSETTEPLAHVELKGRALATSGGYQRGVRIGEKWYPHVLDPRTGQPVVAVLGATVIAERAEDADALVTALCVLPAEQGLALAASTPGAACLLVESSGKVRRGGDWARYETARPVLVSLRRPVDGPSPADDTSWGATHELLVKFEINKPNGDARRLRRPYVAVWVEDGDGVPVRTLVLWVQKTGPGPRWIPDLTRWYKGDQLRKLVDETNLVETVSRATRPPGKYEVLWDGKDDGGKPLAAGKYVLSIEAAREHGTHQVIREPIEVGAAKFSKPLTGNVEIKDASVEYRAKGAPR